MGLYEASNNRKKELSKFDFESDQQKSLQIAGIENKLLFWRHRLKEYKQIDSWWLDWSDYVNKVKEEIEYLEYEFKIVSQKYSDSREQLSEYDKESLNATLEKIKIGWISEIEQINFIEKITDKYNLEKLKALERDVDFYIFNEREERQAQITDEERKIVFEKYRNQSKSLPTLKPPIVFNSEKKNLDKNDHWLLKAWEHNQSKLEFFAPPYKVSKEIIFLLTVFGMRNSLSRTIDMERLFFPYDFFLLYRFHNLVKMKLMQAGSDKRGYKLDSNSEINSKVIDTSDSDGKPGRPFKKELPQTDIEDFLREKLKNKKSKKFIHQSGTLEGKPNINQLSKAFFDENPQAEEIITDRRLKERIKMAYDIIDTSMN